MKNLRKVLATGLSLVLFGTVLVACGGNNDSNSSKPSSSSSSSSSSSNSSSHAHTHSYGDWNITLEPTLTESGTAEKSCVNNDDTVTETLPVLTDTTVWTVTEEQPATCTDDGYVVYSSVYGEVTLTLTANDHTYGEWSIATAPTFETEGLATRDCNENDDTDEMVLPVLSNEEFWTLTENVESTCDEEGYATFTSEYGNVTFEYGLRKHNMGEWTIIDAPIIDEKATATISRECLFGDCSFVETKEVNAQNSLNIKVVNYENADANFIEVLAGDPYFFEVDNDGNWKSNNFNKDNTSATLTFAPKVNGTLSFNVTVSSEEGWDKFNCNGEVLSGEVTKTISISMVANETYKVDYTKDTGGYRGDDCAILSDIVFAPTVSEEVSFYVLSFETNADVTLDPVVVTNLVGVNCMPENPTRDGYVFTGWYLDESFETEYKATPISENTTVFAKWTEAKNVTLVLNNGEENKVLTFAIDEIPTIPSLKREGFKFEGWYLDENFVDGSAYTPALLTEDIILYAKWSVAPEYTGQYEGHNVHSITSVGSEQPLVIDEDGNISGYRNGFITNYDTETGVITYKKDAESDDFFMIYKDGILAFAYNEDKKLPNNDIFIFGKGNVTNALNIALGEAKTDRLVSLIYEDKTTLVYVNGDKLYVNVTIETLDGNSVEMLDLIAETVETLVIKNGDTIVGQFAKDGSTLLPMDGNQGTYTNGEDTLVLNGLDKVTLNDATGTYSVNEGFIEVYVDNTYYEVILNKDNLTYTITKPMVDIVFDAGEYANVDSITINKNIVIELPTPTSETHIFRGWYLNKELTQVVNNSYTPTESLTLYAKWDEKINLRVVYGNDLEDEVFYYGLGDIPSPREPEFKNGLVFEGWYLDEEFNTPYTPSAIYESLVIYCNWKEAHPMYGTYKGYEVYGYNNSGTPSIGYSIVTMYIDAEGNFTGSNNGKIEDYNPLTGEFKYVGEYSTKYGIFDKESGTLAYSFSSNTTTLDKDYYLLFKTDSTVSFDSCSSYWDNFNAFIIEQSIDGTKVNTFVFNNKIYFDVRIESTTANVTAASAYQANDLKIYDKNNNLIAEFVNDGSSLKYLDGYQGTYTNDDATMVLDGANNIVLNGVTGSYSIENGVICTIINGEYFEISVDKDTMTFNQEKPMVTISFNTNGFGTIDSMNVNKNIDIELPTLTSDTHVFDGWYENAELTVKVYGDYTPKSNTTLYAKWNEKVTLTIVYKNGLDNLVQDYSAGDYVTPAKPAFTNGLGFGGWYLDEGFTTPYTDTYIYENTIIYCKWIESLPFAGDYVGYNIYDNGGAINSYLYTSSLSVDANGNTSGHRNGTIVDYNSETGVFYLEAFNWYDTLVRYYGFYDAETGMLIYSYDEDMDTLGDDLYVFFKTQNVNIESSDGCNFLNGLAKLLKFTVDGKEVNVFINNTVAYANVTFTSTTADVTVGNAYNADDLTIYDVDGNVIATFVKGDNGLQAA